MHLRGITLIATMLLTATCVAAGNGDDACGIPADSKVIAADYSIAALKQRYKSIDLEAVEGIWYYNDDNTTLAIERTDGDAAGAGLSYRIVYVDSDDYDLLPGTVVGYIERSANNEKYVMWLYCERNLYTLFQPVKCVATISEHADMLAFEKPTIRLKLRINFARFLPSFFKALSLIPERNSESVPLGFRKIFPAADADDSHSGVIRYL